MAVMVRDDAGLRARLPELTGAAELAVDTEFHSERSYAPQLMLVQLRADLGEPILVDARAGVDLALLAEPLSARPWILHGGESDLQILGDATGATPPRVFDTQVAAGFVGLRWPMRLGELVSALLGRPLDKGATMSDWSARPLSPAQVAYASEDVLVLHPLAAALRQRLSDMGTGAAAEACGEERARRALAELADEDRWRSLPGAPGFDEGERKAARALARWREEEARRADLPRHAVLGDWLILDLVRRKPRSVPEIVENRRVASALARRHGEALVKTLAGARNAEPVRATTELDRAFLNLIRFLCFKCEAERGVSADLLFDQAWAEDLWNHGPSPSWRSSLIDADLSVLYKDKMTISWPEASPAYPGRKREF
jgi:ribonuclease D